MKRGVYLITFIFIISISFISAFNFQNTTSTQGQEFNFGGSITTINLFGNITNFSQLADSNTGNIAPNNGDGLTWSSALMKWVATVLDGDLIWKQVGEMISPLNNTVSLEVGDFTFHVNSTSGNTGIGIPAGKDKLFVKGNVNVSGNITVNNINVRSGQSITIGDLPDFIIKLSGVAFSFAGKTRKIFQIDQTTFISQSRDGTIGLAVQNTNQSENASVSIAAANYLGNSISMLKFSPGIFNETGLLTNENGNLFIANVKKGTPQKIILGFHDNIVADPFFDIQEVPNQVEVITIDDNNTAIPYLTNFNFDVNFSKNITVNGDTDLNGNLDMNSNNITNILSTVYNISGCTGTEAGTFCYDWDYDTMRFVTTSGQVLQMNQETTMPGKNTNSFIPDGSIIYVEGSVGANPAFKLARADNLSTSGLMGVVTKDCNSNQVCPIVYFGLVHNIDTSSYTNGTHLYLSATEKGNFTTTPPEFPNVPIWVATVVRVHATEGSIFVFPRLDSANGITMNTLGLVGDFIQTDYKIRSLEGHANMGGKNVMCLEMNGTTGEDVCHLTLQPGGIGQASIWMRSGLVVPENLVCANNTNRTDAQCWADAGNFTWRTADFNTTNTEGADWGITGELEVIKDADIHGNLTLGQKITFALGEMIDNIVDGWIRITGSLNVTGNITGNFIGAEMYSKNNANVTIIPAANTYVNVTENITEQFSNGVSISGGKMTIEVSGRYSLISSVSASDGGNKEFHMSVGINGINQDNCHMPRVIATAIDVGSWSLSCSILVNQNDVVTLMVENVDDGGDVLINDMNLMITRMWDN